MAAAIFDLDDLIEIISELRALGFDISTQQYIAAQNILIVLAANGEMPANPRALRTWLAPILCSSPREQDNFYRYFDRWISQHPDFSTRAAKAKDRAIQAGIEDQPGRDWTGIFRRPAFVIPVVMLTIGLSALAYYLYTNRSHTLAGRVIDSDTRLTVPDAQIDYAQQSASSGSDGGFSVSYRQRQLPISITVAKEGYETVTVPIDANTTSPLEVLLTQPVPPPTPAPTPIAGPPQEYPSPEPVALLDPDAATNNTQTTTQRYARWVRYGIVAFPLMFFAGWWFSRKVLTKALLQKLQSGSEPRLEQLVVKAGAAQLFQGPSFRRTIQELRRHRLRGAIELDTSRTIARTISNGGLFTPSYGLRQALPEYLVLIDRASFVDQQARLQNEIMQRLVQENVFVDTYFFQGDPRFCRREEVNAPYVSLQELAALHPDHHLIVFSDGASFINPLSGEPERWLEMFSSWGRRAIMTPESPAHWGDREWLLAELDFMILPATKEGLAALSEMLSSGATSRVESERYTRPFPSLLRHNPRRWLENQQPSPENSQRLCDQLKVFLGASGYYWLSACAVYPMLHWDLTLYLGFKLLNDRSEIENRLLPLVRLPWFRYGAMPDWLRLKLISGLSPEDNQTTRTALEDLFLTILERPADGVRLDIVPQGTRADSFFQRIKKRIKDWKAQRSIRQFFRQEPPESPLRDYVFLTFMSGKKPRKLTVSLPDAVRRLFFPHGQGALGFRPISLLLLCLLVPATFFSFDWWTTRAGPSVSTRQRFYSRMSEAEKDDFIRERLAAIAQTLREPSRGLDNINTERIRRKLDDYVQRIRPDSTSGELPNLRLVFGRGINYAPIINRTFSDRNLSPMIGLYVAMIESEFDPQFNDKATGRAGLLGLTYRGYVVTDRPASDVQDAALAASVLADEARKKLDGPSVLTLYIVMSYRVDVDIINKVQKEGGLTNNEAAVLQAGFDYLDRFMAAAIIGENPESFLLDMNPLSSYPPTSAPATIAEEIAQRMSELKGPDRRAASDRLTQLYALDKQAVVRALVDGILTGGTDAYRVNLYIARTLGSISNWESSPDQFAKVQALRSSADYQDATFKYWLDRAINNHNQAKIDCDCQNVDAGLLTAAYRRQCAAAEAQLKQEFQKTGIISGYCDSVASGPNATPTALTRATPTPTPSPQAIPSPSASTSPSPTSDILGGAALVLQRRVRANLTVNRSVVTAGQVAVFSVSTDQTVPGVSYRFMFGDGSSTGWQSGGQASHRYSSDGTYNASVEVRSSDGGIEKTVGASSAVSVQVRTVIPNLLGKSEAEARRILGGSSQFSLGAVSYKETSSFPPGTVMEQNPAGVVPPRGSNGTRIDIVVAKAPADLVTVPNLVGMQWLQALAVLKKFNLENRVRNLGTVVISQYPKAGAKVTAGTVVEVDLK
jgi:PASTA domain/PKD domain